MEQHTHTAPPTYEEEHYYVLLVVCMNQEGRMMDLPRPPRTRSSMIQYYYIHTYNKKYQDKTNPTIVFLLIASWSIYVQGSI